MSAAATPAELPNPSRAERLLCLVRKLIAAGLGYDAGRMAGEGSHGCQCRADRCCTRHQADCVKTPDRNSHHGVTAFDPKQSLVTGNRQGRIAP